MTEQATIIEAGTGDGGWIAGLIGEAFHPLAVACWLVPDPDLRARVLPANFRIIVEHALTYGEAHVTDDRSAVAVWFPRDAGPLPAPDAYEQRLAAACGSATGRFQILDELFDQHHPEAPHHHLAFLAVRPGRQGRGLGSMLLAHHHAVLDDTATPAYLEASSQENRDLYLRHGYQPGAPFHLPDRTPMWPMWRPPGGAVP